MEVESLHSRHWTPFVVVIAVMLYAPAWGKIIYVDDDAAGANDGTSWKDAYAYLQDALADAGSAAKPVEIRIGQGTYRPNQGANQTRGDRQSAFRLINGVALRGGFAGLSQPDSDARDVHAYATILSGDLAGDDIELPDARRLLDEPTRADNAYHVVRSDNVDETAILDGVIVANGNADAADSDNWRDAWGGGLYHVDGSLALIDCTFADNSARHGGGLYIETSSGDRTSRPVLTRCTFGANAAQSFGGAVSSGGDDGPCSALMEDCVFIGNYAGQNGGGLWIDSWDYPDIPGQFFHCTFENNVTEGKGAALYLGDSGGITFQECAFVGNRASIGAGIYSRTCDYVAQNCLFAGNWAAAGEALAFGPLEDGPSDAVLVNCILWEAGDAISIGDNSSLTIAYSDVRGGWPGQGNIDADPLFADPGYWDPNDTPDDPNDDTWIEGDFHLKSEAGRWNPSGKNWVIDVVTSPCIDAGDPESPVALEPYPHGGRINMGLYGGTSEAGKSPSDPSGKYGGGSGTAEDPYRIYAAEHMRQISVHSEDWRRHFELVANVDMSPLPADDWQCIGNGEIAFRGRFDGAGHSIQNFACLSGASEDAGLFGHVRGTTTEICNLQLIGPQVECQSGFHVATLVGRLGSGTIRNCHVQDAQVRGDTFVGGLVGWNQGTVSRCSAEGTVSGRYTVGGLAGIVAWHGQTLDCHADAQVTGTNRLGGLAGTCWLAEMHRCSSAGQVKGQSYIGGLIGISEGGIVDDSYSTASVSGSASVGGLAGQNAHSCDCSAGREPGQIHRCYAAGPVAGQSETGGLTGLTQEGCIIDASFWDIETSGQATSSGGAGKTTAQMKTTHTFTNAGWDFANETANGTEDIWSIDEGRDYPRLSSQPSGQP